MRRATSGVCAMAVLTVLAVPALMTIEAAQLLSTRASTGLDAGGVRQAYSALPLAFEANRGQVAPGPGYVARGSGYAFLVGAVGATLEFTPGGLRGEPGTPAAADTDDAPAVDAVHISLVGADPHAVATTGAQAGTVSSFTGTDPSRWRSTLPDYTRVEYHSVYPGIDLVYHGVQGALEYDFLVAPGADPRTIRVRLDGAPAVAGPGTVALGLPGGTVVQHPATVTQPPVVTAARPAAPALVHRGHPHPGMAHSSTRRPPPVPVGGGFEPGREGELRLALGAYDHSRPLVVDPLVTWSPALGGGVDDSFVSVAGRSGDAYLVTGTPSAGAATGGAQVVDLAVLRLDRVGQVVYRTFLGGGGDTDVAQLGVDPGGGLEITVDMGTPPAGQALLAAGGRHLTVRLDARGLPLALPRTGAAAG